MFSPDPVRARLPLDDAELDAFLNTLPEHTAVFLLDLAPGQQPYLGRSVNLRRRMKRVLRPSKETTRLLNLRGIATGIAYWLTGSALEANLVLLEQARKHFPDRYRRMLRLRFPSYLRLLASNRFPRVIVTSQVTDLSHTFGPFLYRSQAEEFRDRVLDLFLLRRCEEDLSPSPDHPGCIYGEMNLCLRPCQAAVSDERYGAEADAFMQFLASGGESLREQLEAERSVASENLNFEAAAKAHKRLQKAADCWRGQPAFSGILKHLDGVAVTADLHPRAVRFWPVHAATPGSSLSLEIERLDGPTITSQFACAHSADIAGNGPEPVKAEAVRESLAVLTKWAASSWCDGEWIKFLAPGQIPTRKVINAARRVHQRRWGGAKEEV
ncbi:MAG: hypothetical protein LC114_00335 [Bryobacterales bacterium]|nr:hypothetical protein [Bryobacterales bacterium]